MSIIRNKKGQFAKGCKFWLGKKRPDISLLQKGKPHPWSTGSKNNNWKGGPRKKHCLNCGKEYFVRPYAIKRSKFCSRSCRSGYTHRGAKNCNWKGGVTEFNDKIRRNDLYKKWQLKVFQRDRFTCKWCDHRSKKSKAHGDKTSDIHAHHLDRNKRLFYKVGNGITLCITCHLKTYGKEEKFAKVFKEILRDYTSDIRKEVLIKI